jgi:predicted nucleotidyltransferase
VSDLVTSLETRLTAKRLRMVFAAEAGSRAWGFASPDSDYDVRFIFMSEKDRYLSLFDPIQDINYLDHPNDYAGWDLKKALVLASKSNPSLIEWLGSPIIYRNPMGFQGKLRTIMDEQFSPSASPAKKALCDHVLSCARISDAMRDTAISGKFTIWHRKLRVVP